MNVCANRTIVGDVTLCYMYIAFQFVLYNTESRDNEWHALLSTESGQITNIPAVRETSDGDDANVPL